MFTQQRGKALEAKKRKRERLSYGARQDKMRKTHNNKSIAGENANNKCEKKKCAKSLNNSSDTNIERPGENFKMTRIDISDIIPLSSGNFYAEANNNIMLKDNTNENESSDIYINEDENLADIIERENKTNLEDIFSQKNGEKTDSMVLTTCTNDGYKNIQTKIEMEKAQIVNT
ncbi:3493_t:CDS:2 [Racocetra fulgida]|uniref:3493_t:CDS:1 n=1 Tax=Racocetra fulgida TaxID=60492 RepID=A0A9N9DCX7_9GLOM|nr:3493_t:CDS:2 [Racocetra fulgida]